MTTVFWILILGLLITIIITIILNTLSSDTISPKLISNSFEPYEKEEFDSILLKSLQKYIGKFFIDNKQRSSPFKKVADKYNLDSIKLDFSKYSNFSDQSENLNFVEILKNYENSKLKITNSTKISMYPDKEKNFIYILSISNERDSVNQFENKIGELSLYSIPMKNFLRKEMQDTQEQLENSLIKLCWTSRFYGKIIGAVSSTDKRQISVFYRIIKGHTVSYRIRFFHNADCDNGLIEKTDQEMDGLFNNLIDSTKNAEFNNNNSDTYNSQNNNRYFEILENLSSNYDSDIVNSKFSNYFNDDSYDDFVLVGNTPIVAMTIKQNVIAYSRNVDYRQFYILNREKSEEGQRSWKVSFAGPLMDKRVDNLFHTNSLKFIHDENTSADYKLLHIFITANTSGIHLNKNLIKANHTDYSDTNKTNDYYNTNLIRFPLNDEILNENINKYEEFNLEVSMKNLKEYMRPTIFSNSGNNKRIAFEFTKGIVYYLAFSNSYNQVRWIQYKFHKNERVNKISADSKNENVIIKFDNSNEFTYVFLIKEKENNKTVDYKDIVKTINFKALPKRYRNKEISSFFVENIRDKVLLFLLNSDGVILSLDLTKYNDKWRKNWLTLFMHEFNYTAVIIMLTNIFTIAFYMIYVRNRRRHIQTRNTEINQTLQEFIRLNNIQTALGNNLITELSDQPGQNNTDTRNINNETGNVPQHQQQGNNQNIEELQQTHQNSDINDPGENNETLVNMNDGPQIVAENIINNIDINLINEDNQ